ncbi:MAG: thermonuclease family protein [Hyphomicrobiaceae bacterium]
MFGWRRKNDGFEWHKYVRTTIKLRREQRRARIEEIGQAAVAGLKDAGRAGTAAGVSGAAAIGRGLVAGAVAVGRWLAVATAAAARSTGRAAVFFFWLMYALGIRLAGLCAVLLTRTGIVLAHTGAGAVAICRTVLGAPGVRMAVVPIGLATLASGAARFAVEGFDKQAGLALGIAAVALLASVLSLDFEVRIPSILVRSADTFRARMPRLAALQPVLTLAAGLAVVAGLISGIVWFTARTPSGATDVAGLPRRSDAPRAVSLPFLTGGPKIEGEATVLSGDMFRLAETVIRLAGIEAPEREQRCTRPGTKRWRCGDAAAEALTRMVKAKIATCVGEGRDDAGRTLATCTVNGTANIAADLVRDGHVFAAGGAASRYAVLEKDAKTMKLGVWRGEVERPSDYRAKLWENAKRNAPEGCPIKGQVSSEGKVYVLPWSPSYSKAKVREAQGERWFCSEREAVAAGWRPSEKS